MSKHKTDHGRHRPLPRLIKFLFSSADRAENADCCRPPPRAAIVRENLVKLCQGIGPCERNPTQARDA